MKANNISKELGGTKGCIVCLAEGSYYSGAGEEQWQKAKQTKKRELYISDAWFTQRK